MDPQTAWKELLAAYAGQRWDEVEELAEGLLDWLGRGGFPPTAIAGSDLGEAWDRALALAGCTHALQRARQGGGP